MDDMTCNESIAALLLAYQGRAVIVWHDGTHFKAGLVDRPMPHPNPASECRDEPELAVGRLREILATRAVEGAAIACTHLERLTAPPSFPPRDTVQAGAHSGAK